MALFAYQQQLQRFLREAKQDFINPEDLIVYINRARRQIAMDASCIRRLTPISGAVVSCAVTDGGTGYTDTPTCTISDPDFPSGSGVYPNGSQATAIATVLQGVIQSIDIQEGGAGYWQPTITITDTTGSGAEATLTTSTVMELEQGREVYKFSDIDLSEFPGVDSVYMIKSVSLLFSAFRYSLACYDFSTYQALIRQWAQQWQYVPAVCAQYGQGNDGSFYMYPIPSQAYQLEFDCLCLPSDLTDDQSVEALPLPWTEAVPYFAAHLGFLELQNFNAANFYFTLYDKMLGRYSMASRPGRRINPYGRV